MTEIQPEREPARPEAARPEGSAAEPAPAAAWNRQPSSYDWEGWIAEANAEDARKAAALAAAPPAPSTPAAPTFPGAGFPRTGFPSPRFPSPRFPSPGPTAGPGWAPTGGYPPPAGAVPPFVFANIPTKRPLDPVSVCALVFGILPTIPVGFILGIVGLVRTANPLRRGRWMAVTGLVLSVLWAAVAVAAPIYLATHDAQRDASGAVTHSSTVSPLKLRQGDCYNNQAALSGATRNIATVDVVPCTKPHNSTVFGVVTLSGGSWTNSSQMLTRSVQACVPAARTFFQGHRVNPRLMIGALFPTKADWVLGNRSVRCIVVDPDKQFTGDVRDDN